MVEFTFSVAPGVIDAIVNDPELSGLGMDIQATHSTDTPHHSMLVATVQASA